MSGMKGFRVVSGTLPSKAVQGFKYLKRLDRIGAAYFARTSEIPPAIIKFIEESNQMKVVPMLFRWNAGVNRSVEKGQVYSTVCRLPHVKQNHEEDTWSFVVTFEQDGTAAEPIKAMGNFLVESAPQYLLEKGQEIELLEGTKLCAVATVL